MAFVESYVQLRSELPEGALVSGFGRYIDRFERREGAWRIARRHVTVEGVSAASGFRTDQFVAAWRDRQDPCYER